MTTQRLKAFDEGRTHSYPSSQQTCPNHAKFERALVRNTFIPSNMPLSSVLHFNITIAAVPLAQLANSGTNFQPHLVKQRCKVID
eukprot:66396-Amphidinium_carterae.2